MEIENYLRQFPPFTTYYLVALTVSFWVIKYDIFYYLYLYMDLNLVVYNYQIWRLLTWFLCQAGGGQYFLLSLFYVTISILRLENYYRWKPRALYFLIAISMIVHLIAGHYLYERKVYTIELIVTLAIIYARLEPDDTVNLIFFKVRMEYVPWILSAIAYVQQNEVLNFS